MAISDGKAPPTLRLRFSGMPAESVVRTFCSRRERDAPTANLYIIWLLKGEQVWVLTQAEVQTQRDRNLPKPIFIYPKLSFS